MFKAYESYFFKSNFTLMADEVVQFIFELMMNRDSWFLKLRLLF